MPRTRLLRTVGVCARVALLGVTGLALYACASADIERHSPVQLGVGLRAAPALSVGDGPTTVHPMAGVSRSVAGGTEGETDTKLFLGAQLRYTPPSSTSGVWFGGEAAFARRWTSFDEDAFDTETTNGWTFLALAGKPFAETGLGTWHIYAAAGLAKYGGTGLYSRVGIDLQR